MGTNISAELDTGLTESVIPRGGGSLGSCVFFVCVRESSEERRLFSIDEIISDTSNKSSYVVRCRGGGRSGLIAVCSAGREDNRGENVNRPRPGGEVP